MNSICFVANHQVSLEARLYTQAISRLYQARSYKLITTCSTAVEMIAFRQWIQRERTVDLVIPPEWKLKPGGPQEKIVDAVKESMGHLIETRYDREVEDPRFVKMLSLARLVVVVELAEDHWLLNWSQRLFDKSQTMVLQWAIPSQSNTGCLKLVETGRGMPLYPANWKKDMEQFLSGDFQGGHDKLKQLKLL